MRSTYKPSKGSIVTSPQVCTRLYEAAFARAMLGLWGQHTDQRQLPHALCGLIQQLLVREAFKK